jgi:HPt (histidine-containing phosphotransfer) domain-containing protein
VGQADMFLANGFDDFLSKPIDTQRLDMLLNKLIHEKQPPEAIKTVDAPNAHTETVSHSVKKTSALILTNPRLLVIFVRDIEKTIQTLEGLFKYQFHRDADKQLYTVTVHGIKSALASIDEAELSAFAQKLENAGKTHNTAEMISDTPLFIDGLRKLIEKITPKE